MVKAFPPARRARSKNRALVAHDVGERNAQRRHAGDYLEDEGDLLPARHLLEGTTEVRVAGLFDGLIGFHPGTLGPGANAAPALRLRHACKGATGTRNYDLDGSRGPFK